jgi:methylated-DNA-[protein]-cysteine S-methyltransferase
MNSTIARHPAWQARATAVTEWGSMLLVRSTQGLAGAWIAGQAHHPVALDELPEEAEHPWFVSTLAALQAWSQADALLPPLDPQGTAFQRAVWQQLRHIPRGSTRRYGELAAQLGKPSASRAVGAAVGRNPISILLPCHRVIGKDGSLTGYAGGLALKQRLLQLEGAL